MSFIAAVSPLATCAGDVIAIREKDGFLDRFTEVRRLAIMFMNVARLLLELFNLSFFASDLRSSVSSW